MIAFRNRPNCGVANGWQPIETVPEEGRYLVFGTLEGQNEKPEVYLPNYPVHSGNRFCITDGWGEDMWGEATHWHPITEPEQVRS